jgi:hypothetical protein
VKKMAPKTEQICNFRYPDSQKNTEAQECLGKTVKTNFQLHNKKNAKKWSWDALRYSAWIGGSTQ